MKVISTFAVAIVSFGIYEAFGPFVLISLACLGIFIFNRIQTIRARLQD